MVLLAIQFALFIKWTFAKHTYIKMTQSTLKVSTKPTKAYTTSLPKDKLVTVFLHKLFNCTSYEYVTAAMFSCKATPCSIEKEIEYFQDENHYFKN